MTYSVVLPILFLIIMIMTAPSLVMASNDNDNNNAGTTLGQANQGVAIQDDDDDQEEQPPQCVTTPCPTEPGGGTGGQPQPQLPAIPSGRNLAESNQVGGIGSGNIRQNAQGAVNEQYCSTIGGIGDRRCQQQATEGAQNIQDCSALAGLGKANCVQSEQGGGVGTCLTANGRPYICQTDTGVAISGSGQAGQ